MKNTLIGVLVGVSIAVIMNMSLAYARGEQKTEKNLIPGPKASNCMVRVGYGSMTLGDRCYGNRVMVGVRDEYIYCADISVSCR